MIKDKIIKRLRTLFFLGLFLSAMVILTFELGVVERGTIFVNTTEGYMVEVTAVLLTIALIPLALIGFSKMTTLLHGQPDVSMALKSYCVWSEIRIAILLAVVIIDIGLYYGTMSNSNFYLLIISYTALLYAFPTRSALNEFVDCLHENIKRGSSGL